jgi:4-amino-4-deoxy-L-arabinose transferase-like glycosyltransferase
MSLVDTEPQVEPKEMRVAGPGSAGKVPRVLEAVGLLAVTLVAASLRLWSLDQNGYGNFYYAAAVRSMLVDWNNFFFGSFDPAGFLTVDKPPVAIWMQALSARVFGYSGLSLLVPQALLGTGSVVLTYFLVRRIFGRGAGLSAALMMALTPISVAVDRDNLPDTSLVFVLLLASWALARATESGALRPLLLAAALVGVGFNIKMLAAFVVLPAFYLTYFLLAPVRWWVRIRDLTVATLVLALVSASWSIAVELTPPEDRPYIGGSKTNSAFELALGYNGLGRVFGGSGNFRPKKDGPPKGGPQKGAPKDWPWKGPRPDGRPPWQLEDKGPKGEWPPGEGKGAIVEPPFPPWIPGTDLRRGFPPGNRGGAPGKKGPADARGERPPDDGKGAKDGPPFPPGGPWDRGGPGAKGPPGGPGRGGPGRPGGFGGTPGLLRFAGPELAGQITWLFPLALLGAVVSASRVRWRYPRDPALVALFVWLGWLATHWAVFSWAQGIFHEYYTTVMGPSLAVLAAAGGAILWWEWFYGGWRGFLLPVALLLTAAWQAFVVSRYPELREWFLPTLLSAVGVGIVGLFGLRWLSRTSTWAKFAGLVGFAALLIGPACWSLTPLLEPGSPVMPIANPTVLTNPSDERPRPGPPPETEPDRVARLVDFLRANRGSERFLVAAQNSRGVSSIIIASGEPAISFGGFLGADPVVTKEEFASLVETGQLRFVLDGPGGPGGKGPGGKGPFGPPGGPPDGPDATQNAEIMDWVRKHGKEVDPRLWQDERPADGPAKAAADGRGRPPGPGRRMERLLDCNPQLGLVQPHSRPEEEK